MDPTDKLTGKTILVVDDDADLRMILVSVLAETGAELVAASNGTEAFELLKNRKFDAVITDIRMANGDGIQLIKNINENLPVRPLIFISSAFDDLDPKDYQQLGVVSSFAKPFQT
jgi:two-component system response regulator HydG